MVVPPHLPDTLSRRTFLACVASGLASVVGAQEDQAPAKPAARERADFFRQGMIPRLEITVAPKEMESLRKEPRNYISVTVKDGDKVYRNVGMHVKGAAGSFRHIDDKPALTLNCDKFVPGQLYHGLDKFHLNNSVQDGTYLTELLCAELFHAAGVPVSFCTHATVTLNGKPRGFYVLKEGYDTGFLRRYFKNLKGNLYDGGFLQDIDGDVRLSSSREDVKERADLKALVQACNERNHVQRLRRLEKLLDLEKFLTLMALEVITWHWDGYAMKRNNYRVYHEPTLDKLYFIPHGMDQMFGDPNGPIQPPCDGMVARAILQTGDGKQQYRNRFAEMMRTRFHAEEMVKRIDSLEKRVRPALASVDAPAGREYPEHLKNLRAAIRQRAVEIRKQAKQQWRMAL